jgi:hypothetical protein
MCMGDPFQITIDMAFQIVYTDTLDRNGDAGCMEDEETSRLRGTLQQQTIGLENGATTIMNHFYVTSLEVLSRSKRSSITAYEKERQRDNWIKWVVGSINHSSVPY